MKQINVVNTTNTVKIFCKKHAPEILAGVSAVATIGAVYMSAKNTRVYDEKKIERKDEIQSKLDSVVVFGEAYWPTIVLTATAIAASVGSSAISKKRQATLLLAYNMLEKKFQKYKDMLADANPDAYYTQERMFDTRDLDETVCPDPGENLYYEPIMNMWLTATSHEIVQAMSDLNRELVQGGEVSVYALYVILGIEDQLSDIDRRIAAGIGWCSLDECTTGMKQTEWIEYGLIDKEIEHRPDGFNAPHYTVLDIHNWPQQLY